MATLLLQLLLYYNISSGGV